MEINTNSSFANLFKIKHNHHTIPNEKLKGESFKEFLIRIGTDIIKQHNKLTVINIYKNHRSIVDINNWDMLSGKSIHSLTAIIWINKDGKIRNKIIKTRIRFAYLNKTPNNILELGVKKIVGSWTNIFGFPMLEMQQIYNSIYLT